ncbi:MAG: DUF2190 family protein [Rhodospirillales bacterium]|nr:DUF2190 family protein [Rhodospirillales bacterium]
MATNLHADGNVLDYVAGGTVSSGDVIVTGDTVGVLLKGGVSGDVLPLAIVGVFTVAKTAGTAWVQGDAIDWDASASAFHKGVTPAAGDVVSAGIAYAAAASAATTASIRLLGGGLGAAVT